MIRRLLVSSAHQPFLVDAVVSGIGRRETDFLEQLAREASRGNSALARAVAGATQSLLGCNDRHWMTLKPAEHERATPLFKLASDAATPEWVRTAILDGIEQYVPKAPNGRLLAANVGSNQGRCWRWPTTLIARTRPGQRGWYVP